MDPIQLKCTKCPRTFRWVPVQRINSTIKPKPPKEPVCLICKNTELLKQAKFNSKKDREKNNLESLRKAVKSQQVTKAKNGGGKKRKNIPWKEKSTNSIIQHVQKEFCNPYIRARDIDLFHKCISCNSGITQAGHRYSVGDFPGMRFLVNNIHGQEVSCNHHKSGNVDAYDRGLNGRHGDKYTQDLKQDSLRYIRWGHKWHRFDVIEIGITFKYLHKNKIWIFTQKEFNHFREIANE